MNDLLQEIGIAASDSSCQDWDRLQYKEIHRLAFIEGAEYMIERAPEIKDNAWILCADRMPDYHKPIIFYSSQYDAVVFGSRYRKSGNFISDGNKYYIDDITHWMEVPAKP